MKYKDYNPLLKHKEHSRTWRYSNDKSEDEEVIEVMRRSNHTQLPVTAFSPCATSQLYPRFTKWSWGLTHGSEIAYPPLPHPSTYTSTECGWCNQILNQIISSLQHIRSPPRDTGPSYTSINLNSSLIPSMIWIIFNKIHKNNSTHNFNIS